MGNKDGIRKAHKKLKEKLGEQAYLNELKKRSAKGGRVRSEAKKIAAKLREAKKREAKAN